MTLEQLTSDISKLEEMTDAQLEEHLKPYLKYTRPDSPEAIHVEASAKKKPQKESNQLFMMLPPDKRKALEEQARKSGLDINELLK